MRLHKIYLLLLILSFSLGSCEKMMKPEDDFHSTFDRLYTDAYWANGLLGTAYSLLPYSGNISPNDVATDDAVTNNQFDRFLRMATGEWSALFNPVNIWTNCNRGILYVNKFLIFADTVNWQTQDGEINLMYNRRLKGEAYALRGLLKYQLLQTVGGFSSNGELMGIPIYNDFIDIKDNFNVPRASFTESVDQIYSDLDKALEYLTMDDYKDITLASQLPQGLEGANISKYNSVFGSRNNQLISGRSIKAIKARVALLVASPAFSDGDVVLWEKAANYAGTVINGNGGISGLDPQGHVYYNQANVDAINLASNKDSKEILWRFMISTNNYRESANFPPSLYGNGNINPTQNLVDAFPMANGYPISHALGTYNPLNPYAGRDPRLANYICYNGNKISNVIIKTSVGGGINAKDSIQSSTRTGYYLKKLLREDVNMNPVSTSVKKHYTTLIRYTEIFLIYAEAANEAWGPTGTGAYGFSSKDIIGAIRKRAGIQQPDNYLASITTKDAMRDLVRNERRIELCFEGFRFWDLRRWKADLTETAKGVNITQNAESYNVVNVEPRAYNNDYMHYGPLPNGEVIKFPALIQNNGW